MSDWVQLTDNITDAPVHVNLSNVVRMDRSGQSTIITSIASNSDSVLRLAVHETPDQIMERPSLRLSRTS